MRTQILTALTLAVAGLVACGMSGCSEDDPTGPAGRRTLHVPRQFDEIQDAIDAAAAGDLVLVAAGTYADSVVAENLLGIPQVVCVDLKSGVEVRSESGQSGDVILVGNPNNPVINCLDVDDEASLIGVTITGGKSGLLGARSSPAIVNCVFEGNHNPSQYGAGGGMYWDYSSPTITNCVFSDNSATTGGGAVFANESYPVLTNVVFSANTSPTSPNQPGSGGGLFVGDDSYARLTNCVFTTNHADSLGGAIMVSGGTVELVNGNIHHNHTDGLGGAFFMNYRGHAVLTDVLVESNSSDQIGGGFYFRSSTSLTAVNSRILGNSAPAGADGFLREPYEVAVVSLRCCEVDTLQWVGPITVDDEGCE